MIRRPVAIPLDNRLSEPLTIPEARVNIIYSQTVSAGRQGQILFLGKEIPTDAAGQKPGSGKLEEGPGDAGGTVREAKQGLRGK